MKLCTVTVSSIVYELNINEAVVFFHSLLQSTIQALYLYDDNLTNKCYSKNLF